MFQNQNNYGLMENFIKTKSEDSNCSKLCLFLIENDTNENYIKQSNDKFNTYKTSDDRNLQVGSGL